MIDRRRMLASGGAIAASAWIAPSVLTLDRVAAAVGSGCAAPPVQVDWSAYAGTYPTNITANDGTTVTISFTDPNNVATTQHGLVFNGTTSTVDSPILMAMDRARRGDRTEVLFTFSNPVALCFDLIDVDRGTNSWEDTMELRGTLSGVGVPITAADVVTGSANTFSGTNTILGTSSSSNTSSAGQASVNYPSPIDQLRISHRDNSNWRDFQYIGIHDLHWC
jgi:hypothetical protein